MKEEEKLLVEMLNIEDTYIENSKVKKVQYNTNEAKILFNLINKQQKELEFYSKQELSYIGGYQDGKNHKQTAVAFRVENAQQELFQREIARYKDKIEQQQKEIEELKKENFDTVYIQAIENYKTKIREKIKELSKTQAYKVGLEEYTIKILNELLED